jgi:hypothetical protein
MYFYSLFLIAITIFSTHFSAQAMGRNGGPKIDCGANRLLEIKQSLFFDNNTLIKLPQFFNSGKRRALSIEEVRQNLDRIDLNGEVSADLITPEVMTPLDTNDAIFIINSLTPVLNGNKIEFATNDSNQNLPKETKEKLNCGDGRKLSFNFKISCDMRTKSLQIECK